MSEPEPKESVVPPILVSLVVTLFAILLAIFTMGAGHGVFFVTKILFPYTMISTAGGRPITLPFVILAVVQFPIYGVIVALSGRSGVSYGLAVKVLLVMHLAVAALALLAPADGFTP